MIDKEHHEKKIEEDWNFDFSQYKSEEDDDNFELSSIIDSKRPNFIGLKSRFSTGEQSLNLLIDLKRNITKYSIEVGSRQADLQTLWRYYALLDELWEQIRNTFGSYVNNQMSIIKRKCRELLEKHQKDNTPPNTKLYNRLQFFRSKLYRVFQLANFGFEVERTSRNQFHKSQRKIIE